MDDAVRSILAPGLANGNKQIFRRNTTTKEIELISVSSSGAQAAGNALNATINSDGRQIAFESRAANLVANDTGGSSDIFVRRLDLLRTVRVSVNASGSKATPAASPRVSAATAVTLPFASVATNLDASNPKQSGAGSQQIFVHDRDVSDSGTYDSVGNAAHLPGQRHSSRFLASYRYRLRDRGSVTGLSVLSGGSGYISAFSPPSSSPVGVALAPAPPRTWLVAESSRSTS